MKTLEALYYDIDRVCYYGFSFKLIKVIMDGLGVFRLEVDEARGPHELGTSIGKPEDSTVENEPRKDTLKKLEELNKAE